MARKFFDGFELNSETNGMERVENVSPGSSDINTTVVYSGTYAYHGDISIGGSPNIQIPLGGSNRNFIVVRYRFRLKTSSSGNQDIFSLLTSGFAMIVRLSITSGDSIQLKDEDGNIGSPLTINKNQWYLFEVKMDRTGAAGSHIVGWKVDGSLQAGSSARSLSLGVQRCYFGLQNSGPTTGEIYLDDVAWNDETGSFQNDYPGDGKIIYMRPNAAGDNTDWTPSAGSNYQNVDEATPNDATDYNSSTTLNQIDDFELEAAPSEIGSSDTINAIGVGVRFAATASSSNPSFVVRIKSTSGGTVEESAAITPASTSYQTNAFATNAMYHPLVIYDLPGASTTAWTKADLDTTQIGYRISVDNTNTVRISAIWLVVDFTTVIETLTVDKWHPPVNLPPSQRVNVIGY